MNENLNDIEWEPDLMLETAIQIVQLQIAEPVWHQTSLGSHYDFQSIDCWGF